MLLAALAPAQVITPAQMSRAYGVDQIKFGSIKGDGAGQTIAIVDAFDAPTIVSDLAAFNAKYGLPTTASGGAPIVTKVFPGGSTPGTDTTWAREITLDVEWAHAIAPGAKILLVEADDPSFGSMLSAVYYAAGLPDVSVVSMSWGLAEFDLEPFFDAYFVAPDGHAPVSYVASAGDVGAVTQYPAVSSNVVAVGGTTLQLSTTGAYGIEKAWASSGGGVSAYVSAPSYQSAIATSISSGFRSSPDVAWDANPSTGVKIIYGGAEIQVGGTSLGAPCFAAVVAIADQGRVLAGKTTLDGGSQLLPALYSLPAYNFHDIVSGTASSGSGATFHSASAAPGYDLVTGRGSPYANLVVASLVNANFSTVDGVNGPTTTVTFATVTFPNVAMQTSISLTPSWNSGNNPVSPEIRQPVLQVYVGSNFNQDYETVSYGGNDRTRFRFRIPSRQMTVSSPALGLETAAS
ncbi:MAG: S53 family peptidase [Planctomycetia bacterium]|nr:S53 family peptidase [Planctomycetia bacterium]